MKTYVVYHKNCSDGFGAAYAAWKKFYDLAEYIPISHIDPIPEFEEGSIIYVVDFCFPKNITLELIKKNQVITLDHHISSKEDIQYSTEYVYDLHRSGAKIAWDYFHPGTKCDIIEYISDKDLGIFRLFKSREIISAIESYPRDFKVWDNFIIDSLIQEGNPILRAKNIEVNYALEKVLLENIGGDIVPSVNSSMYANEIAELLIQQYPDAKFVAVYYDFDINGEQFRKYSLRSKTVDVNLVAAKYHGGGHQTASAFVIKTKKGIG